MIITGPPWWIVFPRPKAFFLKKLSITSIVLSKCHWWVAEGRVVVALQLPCHFFIHRLRPTRLPDLCPAPNYRLLLYFSHCFVNSRGISCF